MNIREIAQLAGVSVATVSRVINHSPKVSEESREKVLSVMEEYHYTPNVFAQGLNTNSIKTVGIPVSYTHLGPIRSHTASQVTQITATINGIL